MFFEINLPNLIFFRFCSTPDVYKILIGAIFNMTLLDARGTNERMHTKICANPATAQFALNSSHWDFVIFTKASFTKGM